MQLPRDEAERLLAIVRDQTDTADDRKWTDRARDIQRAIIGGSLEQQARALHALYRARFKPTLPQRRMMQKLEDGVVGPIAAALGRDRGDLARELEALHPALSKDARPAPPEPSLMRPSPPAPVMWPDHDFLGTIRINNALAVGERPSTDDDLTGRERPHYLGLAAPGEWYAFVRGDEEITGLVVVHADHARRLDALAAEARDVCRLTVTRDQIGILDAAVVHDVRFTEELDFPLFEEGLLHDRGCHCHTRGPGSYPLFTVEQAGAIVYARIDLA